MKKRVGPASKCVVNDTPHFNPISSSSVSFSSVSWSSHPHSDEDETKHGLPFFRLIFVVSSSPTPRLIPFVHALTFGARRSFPTAAATNLLPVKICIILKKIEKHSDKKVSCLRSRNFDKRGIKERNPFFVRFIAGS